SVDLGRYGVLSQRGPSEAPTEHSLGHGHSCAVVQYLTTDAICLNSSTTFEPGTLVALKLFQVDVTGSDVVARKDADRKAHQAILRELKVLTQPTLRGHENIYQLLFVAWIEDTPYPALALSLAGYGSLEMVIVGPGCGLTCGQKINVTVDIALGLAGLHACDVCHGDLKPGNVLLFPHETRQVVAKLTDFGGSVLDEDSDASISITTPLWCAPEVLLQKTDLGWPKADVYSYGLLVASLWARPEHFINLMPSSCVLDLILGVKLSAEEKEDLFLLIKSQPESSRYN
ncbi:hypothetical protein LTR95_019511, partial [Oleoguttula sp. CCFEE 5521]